MSDESTARLALPLLLAGQAQKELSHNEALTLLDIAVQPVVLSVGRNDPPASAAAGACWIVGTTPTGAWSGHADALAAWTAGGWRFVAAREGMTAWSVADGAQARFGGGWTVGEVRGSVLRLDGVRFLGPRQAAIAEAAGGTTIDAEARAALAKVLGTLRAHGLVAP